MITAALEDVWRDCAPGVLGALVRRYGDFDAAEDAAQEALWRRLGSGRRTDCRRTRRAG